MKKVLFVVLEIESASGTCVLNVAEELVKNGWKVDLLTYDSLRVVPNSIRHIKIKPKYLIRKVEQFSHNNFLRNFFYNAYRAQIALTFFVWPLNSPVFSFCLYKTIKKLNATNNYSLIVPVYTQLDAVLAGFILKRNQRQRDTMIVPYFLDSLSGGPTPFFLSTKKKIKKGLWWESLLLKEMDGVIYMESSRHHHEMYSKPASYFNKVVFLDIPMLKDIDTQIEEKKNVSGKLEIAYVGSLPKGIRNPEYAFHILSQIKDLPIHITIIGESADTNRMFNAYDLNITWVGKKTREEALAYIHSADVLLNIGNSVKGMVPSKVFEYLSAKKPILSFSPIPDEPSIEYLSKYPAACQIMEFDSFNENIMKTHCFLSNLPSVSITMDDLSKEYYLNTPKAFVDYIDRLNDYNKE